MMIINLSRRILAFLMILVLSLVFSSQAWCWNNSALDKTLPEQDYSEAISIDSPDKSGGKVVLLLLNRLPLQYFYNDLPDNFKKVSNKGSVALLNCNTAEGISSDNTYLTIGSGVEVKGSGFVSEAFKYDDVLENGNYAWEEYYWRSGELPPENSLFNFEISNLLRVNETLSYRVTIGALGNSIHNLGLKTVVLGNADSNISFQRQAVSIAMDESGLVDTGVIDENILVEDDDFIGGFRTDYDKLLSYYQQLPQDVGLVIIETGDFDRLYNARKDLFPERLEELTANSFKRADLFLGSLLNKMDLEKDLLLIAIPTPGRDDEDNFDKLSLVIAYGDNIPKGFLFSPTTKRAGIVASTDIAPTILQYLGGNISFDMSGRPMQVVPSSKNIITSIEDMSEQLILINSNRSYFTKTFVYYQIILMLLSGFCFYRKGKNSKILKPLLLSVLVIPLSALLLPLLPQHGIIIMWVEFILLTLLLTGALFWVHNRSGKAFLFISLITIFILLLDTFLGSMLQKNSFLGYDPVIGARYYGMGNEYMGIFIGSLILGICSLWSLYATPSLKSKSKKILLFITGLVFMLAIYAMLSPSLGTNVGGGIASLGAFVVVFLLLIETRFNFKLIIGIGLVIFLGVGAFILFDLKRPAELQSHMGKAAGLILNGGLEEAWNIIIRKLDTNIRLISNYVWGKLFFLDLLVLGFIIFQNKIFSLKNKFISWKKQNPYLYIGFLGIITGSFLALIFNDSGVVAGVNCMVFAIFPLLYFMLEE